MSSRLGIEELLKLTQCLCYFFNILVTRQEIETLTQKYTELAQQQNDKIDRARFRDILADAFEIDDSLIMDRGLLQLP